MSTTLYRFPKITDQLGSLNLIGSNQPDEIQPRSSRDFSSQIDVTPQVKNVTAQDRVNTLSQQVPQRDDYKSGIGRKILGAFAGIGTGLTTGDASKGQQAGNEVIDRPYTKAYGDWYNNYQAAQKAAGVEQSQEKLDTANERANAYKVVSDARSDQLKDQGVLNLERANDLRDKMNQLKTRLDSAEKIASGRNATAEDIQKSRAEVAELTANIHSLSQQLHDDALIKVGAGHDAASVNNNAATNQNKLDVKTTSPAINPNVKASSKPTDLGAIEHQLYINTPKDQVDIFQPEVKGQAANGTPKVTGRMVLKPRASITDAQLPAWRKAIQTRDAQANPNAAKPKYTVEEVQ